MNKAIVKTFFLSRKFGFLRAEDGEWFFHQSNYKGTGNPQLGEEVTFELAAPNTVGQKQQAIYVTPIKENTDAQKASGKAGA